MSGRLQRYAALAAPLIVMLAAAGCTAAGDKAPEEGAASAPATIEVSLTEFAISPSMIHASAGEPLTFEVSNEGTAPHTFAIDTGQGVRGDGRHPAGGKRDARGLGASGRDLRDLLHDPGP